MDDELAGTGAGGPSCVRPRAVGTSRVGDGRRLGWAEFGHPDGDAVLWFHGTPGACLQLPPPIDEVALAHGFRVIAVERPGSGRSDDHRYARIADFAPDIEALADALGLDRFGVVGLSGGGPYALSVAHRLPDRAVVTTLLGGVGPVRGPDAVLSYTRLLRFWAPPLESLRGPLGTLLGPVVAAASPLADPIFDLYARVAGFADREVLAHPEFKAMFLHDLITAGDLRSVAHDLALFSRHWGFPLDEVQVPVLVWQGLADVIVPPSHGHHLASRLPHGELRTRPGEGHFAGFSAVVEVLERMREVWADRTAEPAPVGRRPR